MHKYFAIFACLLIFALSSCKDKPSPLFEQILAGDFGIGVNFEDSTDRVHGVLGPPTTTREIQGEANIEEFWFSAAMQVMDPGTPQLSLNFHNGSLKRVHNAYNMLDPELPEPPFIIEPVPGVKLGIRRSGFVDALGAPTDSVIVDKWAFRGPEGRQLVLTAEFTDNEETGDSLCTRLTVVLVDALPAQRGEEYEKQQ
jgi:hypothetical protein